MRTANGAVQREQSIAQSGPHRTGCKLRGEKRREEAMVTRARRGAGLTGLVLALAAASAQAPAGLPRGVPLAVVRARAVTAPTKHDTDDPAIWVHPTDRALRM